MPPTPTLNIKKATSQPIQIEQAPPQVTGASIQESILARVNYFVGKTEQDLEKCLAQGLIYGKAQWWQHALEEMIDALAYIEASSRVGDKQAFVDEDTRACILHNMATCCHHLGYFDAASIYYERARSGMVAAPPSHCLFQCVPFLDPRPKQLAFMQSRADACKAHKYPDPMEYFGGDGETRLWKPNEIAAAVVQAKELEGEERKSPALKLASQPRVYAVGSTPRQQLW